jgi:hypothetical protein
MRVTSRVQARPPAFQPWDSPRINPKTTTEGTRAVRVLKAAWAVVFFVQGTKGRAVRLHKRRLGTLVLKLAPIR